jgi:hypothetical protein
MQVSLGEVSTGAKSQVDIRKYDFPKTWGPTGLSILKIRKLSQISIGIQILLGFLLEHYVVSVGKKLLKWGEDT